MSKPGRQLEGELAAVDAILERWGKEVGSDHLVYARLNWPAEAMLSRIAREGAGAGQSGKPPDAISDEAAAVDKAVRAVQRERTREALRLWYCSGSKWSQDRCARRLGVSLRTFEYHLNWGRKEVASILGIIV